MFTTPAYAEAASAAVSPGADVLMQLLPFVGIFVVFYFLLLRPQQTRARQQKDMLEALQKGDQVVTAGGLIGTVYKVVDANEVVIELAPETRVRAVRSTIAHTYVKPADAAGTAKSSTKGS